MAGDGILPLGGLEQHAIVCPATHNCEQEAAEHDRLSSDTYQRLNLALMWWGIGTGLTLWLAPQQPLRMALGCVWRLGWLALLPGSGLLQWQLAVLPPLLHACDAASFPPPLGSPPGAGWAPRCWPPPLLTLP